MAGVEDTNPTKEAHQDVTEKKEDDKAATLFS